MRIGIAAITSTALVGGTLVAVPAHPLLPVTAVAQAQEQQQEARATANAQLINLRVLNLGNLLTTDDPRGVNGVIEAIEAEQNWDSRDDNGQTAVTSDLDIQLLGLLNISLGGVEIPLISDSGNSLLKGQAGLLSAYANSPSATNAKASAGTIGADGSLSLDNSEQGQDAALELDLTNILGVDLPTQLVDELSLSLGAVGASAEKNGTAVTRDYVLADARLTLDAPVLGEVVTGLDDTLGGVGAIVNGLLPTDEELKEQGLSGTLQAVATLVGINLNLGVNVDLDSILETLLREPLADDSGLVSINLGAGTIEIDLDQVHLEGINNLDPNTPLLDEATINGIVTTITSLLTDPNNENGLIGKVESLVAGDAATQTGGLYGTTVQLGVGVGSTSGGLLGALRTILNVAGLGGILDVLVGGFDLETTVGGLLNNDIQATADRATYEASPNEYVLITGDGVVGGLVASVLTLVKGLLGVVGNILNGILFADDGVLATLTAGLPALLSGIVSPLGTALGGDNGILSGLAAITINKQSEENGVYNVTALDVNVLNDVVHLPLASASVSAADEWQDVVAPTIADIDDQTVTVGQDIAPVTPVVSPDDATITAAGLPDGVTLENGVISGAPDAVGEYEVTVTATNSAGSGSTTFTISAVQAEVVPTIATIADQTIDLGDAIAPVTPVVTPVDAAVEVNGLPTGVTFENGVISGTPTIAGSSVATVSATVGANTVTTSFTITVNPVTGTAPTIAAIDNQTVNVGEPIADITPDPTPDDAAITVTGLPAGVTYSGGVISGAPTAVGTSVVTVTATNANGQASITFTITAEAVAPTINPIEDTEGSVDEPIDPIEVVVTPDDADVDVDGLPDGLDYNPDTGIIDGTPAAGTEGPHTVSVTVTHDGITVSETFVITITDGTAPVPPVENGSANGSSEFLQQCLDSPAAGIVGLLVALGAVSAIAGPALEPLLKSIGGEIDRQLRNMASATAGAHQPEWVRNINRGLNDAANAVNHQMVSNALFASAALALVSAPILCGTDNNSSSSS